MLDFLASDKGIAMMIVLGVVGVLGYVLVSIVEAIGIDEYDPICEERCKKCICYDVCRNHGCIYECKDYMTEEMLRKSGVSKDE